ncbi:MAG: hypothetical protein SH847_27715 [Roseiflexaceae bacterium]|nr:hypothetical protein [Roseiflexaceae bacterium]
MLFHPRRDTWSDHFKVRETGAIEPLTAIGRVTVRLLKINRIDQIADRARLIALGRYQLQ